MAVKWHNRTLKRMLDTVGGYTLKAMLLNAYTDVPAHNFVSQIVANEVSATGYARQTLTGVVVTQDDANSRAKITCDTISFGTVGVPAGITATQLAIFRFVTNDADSEIVGVYDAPLTLPTGGAISVGINANGLALLTG